MKEKRMGQETHIAMLPEPVTGAYDRVMHREQHLPGFVKCVTIPAPGEPGVRTVLIMQRYLLTMIETTISREEAKALATALVSHFGFTADELNNEEDKL